MDPVLIWVVEALSASALAIVKAVASDAIKTTYARVKQIIADRYPKASVVLEALEADPGSVAEKEVLGKQLEREDAARDEELKLVATELREALFELESDLGAAALIDFKRLRVAGEFAVIGVRLESETLIRAEDANFEGDVKIGGIEQRGRDSRKK